MNILQSMHSVAVIQNTIENETEFHQQYVVGDGEICWIFCDIDRTFLSVLMVIIYSWFGLLLNVRDYINETH